MEKKKDDHGLKIFPARTDQRIEVVESKTGESKVERSPIGPTKVIIPEAPTAKGRTIRYHEGQHLNHSPKTERMQLKGMWRDTQMGIEDVILHTKYIPLDLPRSALRDEKATALQDLRLVKWYLETSKLIGQPIPDQMWNTLMIMALRSKSVLSRKEIKSVRERNFLPWDMEKKMNNIINLTTWGFLKKAGIKFQRLLREVEGGASQCSVPGVWGAPEASSGASGKKLKQETDLTIGFPMATVGDLRPSPVFSPLPPEQDGPGNIMPIHQLDLDVTSVIISHTRNFRYQSSGSMPHAFKLARAAFSPVSTLFKVKMRKTEMAATFLFDFSGSMSIQGKQLALIMESVPAATIGFYSGHGLTIYASGGKHSSQTELYSDGGNDWDHRAMQWMMKQPKPWFYITDEHFSEDHAYDPGQAARATNLLRINRKHITVYNSYHAFMAAMQKGEVRNKIVGRTT